MLLLTPWPSILHLLGGHGGAGVREGQDHDGRAAQVGHHLARDHEDHRVSNLDCLSVCVCCACCVRVGEPRLDSGAVCTVAPIFTNIALVLFRFHEAGHALMALKTDGANPIYKATIMPRYSPLFQCYRLEFDE